MFLLRFLSDLIIVVAWGLAGNWAGEQMRRLATGEPGHHLQVYHTGPDGEIMIAANPLITNLVPAMLVGLAIKPRWLWAFVGGAITSGLIGERYEGGFFEMIERKCE